MEIAALPDNEQQRLQALYDYQILDTENEKVFDDLVRLAADICATPIALISLVDPNRQWFKASFGLGAKETSRDIAFCSHAILQKDIMEVEDTFLDRRFYDNPLVLDDPNIRFYAGAQLTTPDGYKLGTLCTISDKPHKLTDKQRSSLLILADEVVSRIELHKKIRLLNEQRLALSHKNQELEVINYLQSLYIENTDLDGILRAFLKAAMTFTGASFGIIGQIIKDHSDGMPMALTYIANSTKDSEVLIIRPEADSQEPSFKPLLALCELVGHSRMLKTEDYCVATGELQKQEPQKQEAEKKDAESQDEKCKATTGKLAAYPLMAGESLQGILGLCITNNAFSGDSLKRIEPFSFVCGQILFALTARENTSI